MISKFYTIYQYIFYKCYRLSWFGSRNWLNQSKENYINSIAFSALCSISLFLYTNGMLFSVIIYALTGYGLLIHISSFATIVIILSFIFMNYFIFLHKKQYKKIIKKFEKESRMSRIIGNILVGCYALILFPGSFILAYLISIFHLGKGM